MADTLVQHRLFPTLVYSTENPDANLHNAQLVTAINLEKASDEAGIERSNYAELGGWHSRDDLQHSSEFMAITRFIRTIGEQVSAGSCYAAPQRLRIDSLWAIVNPPGASNRSHIHPGSLWSGVYYVEASPEAGRIEFTDPRTENVMKRPRFSNTPLDQQIAVTFDPKPGLLLLFPSWLYHMVHPNFSQKDRVILSFNLSQE